MLDSDDAEALRKSLKATRHKLEENTDALEENTKELHVFNRNVEDLMALAEQLMPLAEGAAAGNSVLSSVLPMVKGLFKNRRQPESD